MSEKRAYLKNGEIVVLHERLKDGSFVIERMYEYQNYEGEVDIEPSGKKEVVKEVFIKQPTAVIEEKIATLTKRHDELSESLKSVNSEFLEAKRELVRIMAKTTDLNKMIVDRSEILNAKRLTYISDYKPHDVKDGKKKDIVIRNSLSIKDGSLRMYGIEIYEDYNNDRRIQGALLIDKTDDEIDDACREVVKNAKDISDWYLTATKGGIKEEYLTPELLERKSKLVEEKRIADIKEKESKIEKLNLELAELTKAGGI